MKGRVLSAAVCGAILAGCGGSGSLSGDYAQFYVVEYDATAGTTTVSAALRRGGATTQLIPPAGVTANGTALTFTPAKIGAYPYSATLTGRTNVTIDFKDFDERLYENTASVTSVPTIAFPTDFTGFARTGITNFAWSGAAVAAGETVVVQVFGNAEVVREYKTSTVGATSVAVNGGEVFGIGATRARLIRVTTPALVQASPAGGSLTVSYTSGSRTIQTF